MENGSLIHKEVLVLHDGHEVPNFCVWQVPGDDSIKSFDRVKLKFVLSNFYHKVTWSLILLSLRNWFSSAINAICILIHKEVLVLLDGLEDPNFLFWPFPGDDSMRLFP